MMCMFFSSAMLSFVLNRKHLLMMLLNLEFSVIILYFGMFMYFNYMMFEFFYLMIFLTMSVCEGALGLSMMVLMVRSHGNDYIMTFSSLW
uniref:NADH-ubiquinone oxidoreductase chain 4L n=1 Tax=Podagrica fuscicornis TaxID=1425595 RepID=A0A1P8NMN8_9CUCU|nr:NADH dehydrogenase subunit 4L [Podagrica fuscicornis]